MNVLTSIVRYLHYTIGITAPRPEQERKVMLIWIVATLFIVAATVGFFFYMLGTIQSH